MSPGGYNRVAIFTDAFTKLAVFVKCKSTLTSEGLADLYIQNIWRVYGRVAKLVSDNEPILCAEAWLSIHEKLGTKVSRVSAYNAKANGAAEVMVKQMKSMLATYERQGMKWWRSLAACERAYNDSVHKVTGYTPFYMMFGRHPLPDLQQLTTPEEDILIQSFINETQAELARVHEDAAGKILDSSIRQTVKRNAKRTPTLDYKVGDYVLLETSAFRKTPALAPLRSGPYAITQIVAGGNAAYIEGFRHPFNVELLTPTVCYRNGLNGHLTKYHIETQTITPITHEEAHVSTSGGEPGIAQPPLGELGVLPAGEPGVEDVALELLVDVQAAAPPPIPEGAAASTTTSPPEIPQEEAAEEPLGQPRAIEEAVQDFLDDTEDLWEFQPLVRIVPTSQPVNNPAAIIRAGLSDQDNLGTLVQPLPPVAPQPPPTALPILDIPPSTILPAQLPGDIISIISVEGKTRNSAIFLCQMSNGDQCRISQRHLTTLLGSDKVALLLSAIPIPVG